MAAPEAYVVHPFWPGSVFDLSSHFFNWAIGDGALFKRHPKYRYWSFPNLPEMLLLLSPFCFWSGPWKFLKLVPYFLVADFLVDFCKPREYKHRCLTLQEGQSATPDPSLERGHLFCISAHMLGNIYVVVLECGRLWGHMTRMEPWQGLCRRFDWHCGRLKQAPRNFRRREAVKFSLFVCVAAYEFGWLRYCFPLVNVDTCVIAWMDLTNLRK